MLGCLGRVMTLPSAGEWLSKVKGRRLAKAMSSCWERQPEPRAGRVLSHTIMARRP